jgi:glycosyltransferase involved in cell wall biosynthesis
MHVGIDASRAARLQPTGTEGYSLRLIQGLLALDQRHTYTLYFNEAPAPGLFPPGPRCRLHVMPFPRLWTHLRLSAEMAAQPPDLLLVPAHVLPLLHPRRSVVTVHDLGYLHEPQAHRPLDRLYLDLSNRYHVLAAVRLLAISQATKNDLVSRYGVRPERVSVTYLAAAGGMRPVEDPAQVATVKSRFGIAGDYLLFVGTLQPRKNLARLVQAFAPVAARQPALQLVIAGKKGWMYEEIFDQVRQWGLEGRVVFTGYVAAGDLPALYSGALAFSFPSLYEGFGMPVLEAMACGAPVVASNTSSLPEVAGDAALLVDPTDVNALSAALSRIAGDAALRSDLRARGLVQAARFSWERCARETLAALTDAATDVATA